MNDYLKFFLNEIPHEVIDESKQIYQFGKLTIDPDMGIEMFDNKVSLRVKAKKLARKYGFAIPNELALEEISSYKNIMEFGAGTGYWASLLRKRNVKVICFDIAPIKNELKNRYGFNHQHTHVNNLTNSNQIIKSRADKFSLFLCWPCRHSSWSLDTTKKYIEAGGKRVIYVGDYEYNKEHPICIEDDQKPVTGTDELHQFFTNEFKLVKKIDIPHFENIRDALYIFEIKDHMKHV